MIKVTLAGGEPAYINPAHIVSFLAMPKGKRTDYPGAKTEMTTATGNRTYIKETPEEIIEMIYPSPTPDPERRRS